MIGDDGKTFLIIFFHVSTFTFTSILHTELSVSGKCKFSSANITSITQLPPSRHWVIIFGFGSHEIMDQTHNKSRVPQERPSRRWKDNKKSRRWFRSKLRFTQQRQSHENKLHDTWWRELFFLNATLSSLGSDKFGFFVRCATDIKTKAIHHRNLLLLRPGDWLANVIIICEKTYFLPFAGIFSCNFVESKPSRVTSKDCGESEVFHFCTNYPDCNLQIIF